MKHSVRHDLIGERGVVVYVDRVGDERRALVAGWSFIDGVLSMRLAGTDRFAHAHDVQRWRFHPQRIDHRSRSTLVIDNDLDASARRALSEITIR